MFSQWSSVKWPSVAVARIITAEYTHSPRRSVAASADAGTAHWSGIPTANIARPSGFVSIIKTESDSVDNSLVNHGDTLLRIIYMKKSCSFKISSFRL